MAKKQNYVTIEMAREVLSRQLNYIKPCDTDEAEKKAELLRATQKLGLEVIMRSIADLPLEDKDNLTDQVEGRNARLYLFGDVGKQLMVSLGIDPEFCYKVALLVGEPCQSVDDFKGVQLPETETELDEYF